MSYSQRFFYLATSLLVLACASLLFNVAPRTAEGATTTKKVETVKAKAPVKKKGSAKKVVKKSTSQKVAFEYSGWIPYWRTATGTADVAPHLSLLAQVHPFGYTVKKDGSLYDASNLEDKTTWTSFRAQAKVSGTLFIPSVMWSDGATIDYILGDAIGRTKHVDAIVDAVARGSYDGIDIDYEGKLAKTREDFSLFLKELKGKLPSDKILSCTIEARTPPSSLYKNIPADLEYANDYAEINKYCDRVKLMTYDQQSADIKLNAQGDRLYSPVADPAWVSKVIDLTVKDIFPSKLVIGVATYGYIYHVTPDQDGVGYEIIKQEAFNPRYATELATKLKITPVRNRAGELSFTYVGEDMEAEGRASQATLVANAPSGTPSGLAAARGSDALLKQSGQANPFYMLWWSDAQAVADKIALAKKKGLRGVSVFKFDGGQDPTLWSVLK